ncbi:enoyl-CoA hydratase [Yoonia tamlensis]|uniref:Enoyl-CoA hydratase n=1 Tax=Yoonia tamlensis TaxID=390270 RepID=A0A1I6I290_9RHOB|nr:enoyl-CoA hydratase-related protein [Yoonia tamlensis]SFR60821.1 enoyl-CoA hydratase [Yoonia tamlensis]
MSDLVITRTQGPVGIIQFNRPEQLNALNATVAQAVIAAAQAFDSNPSIGCIVLTGSPKAFAAGADISEMAGMNAAEIARLDYFAEWQQFVDVKTPKIAAVNGYALGGGCEVMMMCDFAIAGENAKFGQPEIKLGVIAGIGGTQRMTRLIGRSRSMEMHLTGRMMGAQEALQAGLIARVVADDDVVTDAIKTATTIAGYSRPALRMVRETVMRAEELSLQDGLLHERRVFHALFGSEDQTEGMAAFLEKRKPAFTAR